ERIDPKKETILRRTGPVGTGLFSAGTGGPESANGSLRPNAARILACARRTHSVGITWGPPWSNAARTSGRRSVTKAQIPHGMPIAAAGDQGTIANTLAALTNG